jgi:hypothetical protein
VVEMTWGCTAAAAFASTGSAANALHSGAGHHGGGGEAGSGAAPPLPHRQRGIGRVVAQAAAEPGREQRAQRGQAVQHLHYLIPSQLRAAGVQPRLGVQEAVENLRQAESQTDRQTHFA